VVDAGPAGGALVSLIGAQTEQEACDAVVAAVHGLLPDSKVICSALDPSGDRFRVASLAGTEGYLGSAVALLGIDRTANSYEIDDMSP